MIRIKLICPNCAGELVKNGEKNGKQRYQCKNCGRNTVSPKKEEVSVNLIDNKYSYQENGAVAYITSNKIQSLDDLLKECKIDLNLWEVKKSVLNKWGKNFQVKVWLEKKINVVDYQKFKAELIEDITNHVHKVPRIKHKKPEDKHLLEINLFDLHFGKLGWSEETGTGNYDTKIAEKRFMSAIEGLIERARGFGIDKIVFPVGNDFFHSDNAFPFPQTTKGTPQQEDLRWQKTFRTGRKLIAQGIDYCSQIAAVDVIVIPGNHDFQKSFYLGDVLDVMYSKNSNVNVNNLACPRKYYQYHNNLIGYTHGNKTNETERRLIWLMPMEAPELWAKTKFREWHLGDIHHKRKIALKSENDEQGIVLRYMRSLSGDDAWHTQKGYIGAIKGAEAYLHHKKYGIVANFNYNIVDKET